jgi:predicted TIM-barrel fold metal-dependent hydrolase
VLPEDVKLISVDDHIIEPPHVWQSRLPAALRERGPRVVELENGTEAWLYDNQIVQTFRGSTRTLPEFDDEPQGIARFSEMRPGCYDPVARLADMDLDGVWAQANFPDYSRFAGHRFLGSNDPVLATLCSLAYNDFVLDEWCAADRARLIPLGILPLWDVEAAAAEVRRIASRGAKGIAFSENPAALGLPSMWSDHWEPIWDAVDETDLAVCLHIGSSGRLLRTAEDAPPSMVLPHMGANSMLACTDWLFTGVLDRHRRMRVAFSEGGAGWVPYLLEQAEKTFANPHFRDQFGAIRPPREVFAEQMVVCFMRDDTAMAALDVIGEDNITWESDYPHEDGFFPNSREQLAQTLAGVSETVARKVAETNARRLFRL